MRLLRILMVTFCLSTGFIACHPQRGNKEILTQNNHMMKDTFEELKSGLKTKHIHTEDISFQLNGTHHLATYAVDSTSTGKRPGIVIVPEWWGLNDYIKTRAEMFASAGYAVLAIDPFGNGDTANNPTEAMAFTKAYYDDAGLVKSLMTAAINKIKTLPEVDSSRLGAVGYCFGGYVSLSAGTDGLGLKTAVGFHPSLGGVKPGTKVATKFLICFGDDDDFEKANVAGFKQRMDEAGLDYTFKDYAGSKHAFTNPGATEKGKEFGIPIQYNAAADSASWNDAKIFMQQNLN